MLAAIRVNRSGAACKGIRVTIIAVMNQKGGVGKTTTVINLGAYLSEMGKSVLVVDCDPQGNATGSLGRGDAAVGLYDVLLDGVPADHAVAGASVAGLSLLASTIDLTGAEIEMAPLEGRMECLRTALAVIDDTFDYILLDCPPSLGLLTLNALAASECVLVPVQSEYLALEGLARLMTTLERVRSHSNARLRILGLLMTMVDARTMLSQQVSDEVRRHYPDLTFRTVIPRNVRLGEAPSFGVSIREYDPQSRGARAYRDLASEVIERTRPDHDAFETRVGAE